MGVRSPTSRDLGIGVAAVETFAMGKANLPPIIRRRTWRQRLRSIEWCCRGDTACRQNSASHSAAVAVASTGALRSMGRASGRRSNEPKSRLHRICQLAFLVSRSSWRRLQAIAIAVLLLLPIGANPAQAMKNPASAASTAHVYLLRGVLNIFSLGLDDIAAKLRAQGIPVTVANFASWSSLADEAAAGYRGGRLKTIILVGHSSGATALPDMVAKLDQLGVPVELAIGLDSVFRTSLKGRVGRYINFYIANGAGTPVEKTGQFQGTLENVNVQNVPGVGHMSIEKNQIMQRKVISEIDAVVFGRSAGFGGQETGRPVQERGETRRGKRAAVRK